MKATLWKEIEEHLEALLETPADQRDSYLDRVCGESKEFRRELELLLSADLRRVAFLNSPILDGLDDTADDLTGQLVGPYRIEKELGSGGMGVVYQASRADGEFERQVAIKVLNAGALRRSTLRWFRREVQILARLVHPNIASLFESGRTEDGRYYYALELISGEPLTVYCKDKGLSVPERLELFKKVCIAVHYAHQNLVVHRDLKPGNILVNDQGEPKLVDFGISILLDPERGSSVHTRTVGHVAFTPAYASPEQKLGKEVTTASDVYSLGVILYELLSGRLPRSPEPSASGTLQQTQELPSTKPSEALRDQPMPYAVASELEGDLDTITLKALDPLQTLRYASADQLAADIDRHLSGEPVLAQPASVLYRARKFVRRHRFGVAAAVAATAFSLAFGATMAYQQRQTAKERDRAQSERDRAEEIALFLQNLFEGAAPEANPGRVLSLSDLLSRGAQKALHDQTLRPDIRADLLYTLARIYMSLGQIDEALEFAIQASDFFEQNVGGSNESYANSLNLRGLLHQHKGDYSSAEELYRRSIEEHTAAVNRGSSKQKIDLAGSVNSLARLLIELGRPQEAEGFSRTAIATMNAIDAQNDRDYGVYLSNLAASLSLSGKDLEAESVYLRALSVLTETLGERHPRLGTANNDVGEMYRRLDRLDKAEMYLAKAVALHRYNYGDEHPLLASALANLSLVYRETGRLDDSERVLDESLQIYRKRLAPSHPSLANAELHRAALLLRRGKASEAEALSRRVLAVFEATLPKGHSRTAGAKRVLGECLTALRRFAEAEASLVAAYDDLRPGGVANRRRSRQALESLVALYTAWGRPEETKRYQLQLEPESSP